MLSREHTESHKAPVVRRVTKAAQAILEERKKLGNGSGFDGFLCKRVGEGSAASSKFQPIDLKAPSGQVYSYNNPHLVRSSFSADGLLINYRWASQPVLPGDEAFEFFVSTYDLRNSQMTDWRARKVAQKGYGGSESIRLGLTRPPIRAVGDKDADQLWYPASGENDETLFDAWLLVDAQGSSFVADGRWEALAPIDRLLGEVNTLTLEHQLDLDGIRQRAAQEFSQVVGQLQSVAS